MLSLPGAVILGARTNRWKAHEGMRGHSVPLVCLGFLILNFGFLAFNGGSQGAISNPGDGEAFSRAVVNTQVGARPTWRPSREAGGIKPSPQLGCGMGGVTGLFIYKVTLSPEFPMLQVFSGHYSLVKAINCAVAAMVSLCAGCNLFAPWAACLVAAVGAAAYLLISGIILAVR